ncbi:hypothetical protein ANCCAN_09607 [Ancylostoma caninum]|uniref:Phorbol-ester/DAG-type domain-containing protein n=1 Tax=Ancylostoma caninum TaxID=29170 RepID=A0A368GJ22_ANCCA|nr:hypothetical protein ANCCAN_09607 [Ancylostoma caninum]
MARGLREGRHRLQEQHRAHALAIQIYGRNREAVKIVAEGRWTVQDRSGMRYVEQDICICDAKLNNHCQEDGCGACAYAFRCECLYDSKSGVCCAHVHAVLLYGSEGRIHDDSAQRTTVSAFAPQTPTTSDAYSVVDDSSTPTSTELYVVERSAHSDTDMLDHNKDAVQQIEAAMAALRADLISISRIANSAVGDQLDKVLSVVTGLGKEVATMKTTHCTNSAKRVRLARRADLPAVGRMPNPPPIRLAKRTTVEPKRQRSPIPSLPEYAKNAIHFCAVCFRRAPATNDTMDDWLKCTSCEMWAHEQCTDGEGSACPYDEGTFQCNVVED